MSNRRIILIVLAVLALPVLGVGSIIGYYWVSGTPLILDEWQCSKGEAPYNFAEGGSACAVEGEELPPGAHWDPLGNRPMDCTRRWGWTEIERDPNPGGGTDCLKDGLAIPDGWRRVD